MQAQRIPEPEVVFSRALAEPHQDLDSPTAAEKPGSAGSEFRGKSKREAGESHVGLGHGPGGTLARSCLVTTGASLLEEARLRKAQAVADEVTGTPLAKSDKLESLPEPAVTPWLPRTAGATSLPPGSQQGMFLALLLNEEGPARPADLDYVRLHRWTFRGAVDIAGQGRSLCFFVICLLELQRGVQLIEDGDALDPKLTRAGRTFVSTQCRQGHAGDMYQLLTHFLSNSQVFHEWARFLALAFQDPRANQEAFLVPHVEQIWTRYVRLRSALEGLFGVLNERFAWKHRLPKVGALVHEHMRRRCFSSDGISKNELFQQAIVRDETLKQVKFAFGYG